MAGLHRPPRPTTREAVREQERRPDRGGEDRGSAPARAGGAGCREPARVVTFKDCAEQWPGHVLSLARQDAPEYHLCWSWLGSLPCTSSTSLATARPRFTPKLSGPLLPRGGRCAVDRLDDAAIRNLSATEALTRPQ